MKILKQVLINLLSSKKAMLAVVGAIAAGLMRLGFNIDQDTVLLILSPILTAIVGQGIADHGKSAAEINKDAPKPPTTVNVASVGMLLIFVAIMLSGCSWLKGEGTSARDTVIDCSKGELAKLEALTPVILPQIIENPDWSTVSGQLEQAGLEVGGCVLANLIDRYMGNNRMATPDGTNAAEEALQSLRTHLGNPNAKHRTGERVH